MMLPVPACVRLHTALLLYSCKQHPQTIDKSIRNEDVPRHIESLPDEIEIGDSPHNLKNICTYSMNVGNVAIGVSHLPIFIEMASARARADGAQELLYLREV